MPTVQLGCPSPGCTSHGCKAGRGSRAIAADHVEEPMRREMRQFVETEQRDLRALPVEDSGGKLQLRESDLAAAQPASLGRSNVRGPTGRGAKAAAS